MQFRIGHDEELTHEGAHHQRLTREMRRQDRLKYLDRDRVGQPRVWTVYAWEPTRREWWLAGFTKGKAPVKRLRKLRRRLKLNEIAVIKLVDLFDAQKRGPGAPPENARLLPHYTLDRPHGQRLTARSFV